MFPYKSPPGCNVDPPVFSQFFVFCRHKRRQYLLVKTIQCNYKPKHMKSILVILLLCLFSSSLFAGDLHFFHLKQVKLLESEFKNAQELDKAYLLAHDPDRLLAPFLIDAGFEAKAPRYGNWENTGLDGHIGGHYLTALAQMYVATGDEELLTRLNYMLDELERCQQKNGNGYIGGIPGGQEMWRDIAEGKINAGAFSLNDKWVPLYNIHKLYAGLRDAWLITGLEQARNMLIQLSEWNIRLVEKLSDEQIQTMLRSEHGGMNEVFADVAMITGDERYLKLARQYSHQFILDPLLKGEDRLNGLHANTQIPKVIGFEQVARAAGDKEWHEAAVFFWNTVVNKRSISIGGNSVREHFHPADDFSSMVTSREGPETCNTYNMMRLSKQLYQADHALKYIDYYERALYNHILSSQHPEHGGLVYFTPARPQHYRVYSKAEEAFWCCVGSGMENHGKYGELIYAYGDNELYVNLFIASELNWEEKGLVLSQNNRFPDEAATALHLQLKKAKRFTLKLRYPAWVKAGELVVKVNGKVTEHAAQPGEYVAIQRKWKDHDRVEVSLPMHLEYEVLPDESHFVSFVYGPLVLAAATDRSQLDGLIADDSRMGHIANGPLYPLEETPVLVASDLEQDVKMKRRDEKQVKFELEGLWPEQYNGIQLEPFYRIHDARYVLYWPYASAEELAVRQEKIRQEEAGRMLLEKQTIDQVAPGEQQPESDHFFKAAGSESGVHQNRHWRHARGWFSYQLRDPGKEAKKLRITYYGLDRDRSFMIKVNGTTVAVVELKGDRGDVFFEEDYQLPSELIDESKGVLEVKFEAQPNSLAGGVYGVRLMR